MKAPVAFAWCTNHLVHDDVIKWKHFPRYWPFVRGIHRSPVNSPHKGQWCGALMFSLICVWINGWVNNREAGDLRRYGAHYDVTVMTQSGVFAHRVERSSTIVPMLRPSALRVNTETELLFWRQNDNFRCSQWPKFRQMTIRSAVKTHGILSMTLNEFACWAKRCWK